MVTSWFISYRSKTLSRRVSTAPGSGSTATSARIAARICAIAAAALTPRPITSPMNIAIRPPSSGITS